MRFQPCAKRRVRGRLLSMGDRATVRRFVSDSEKPAGRAGRESGTPAAALAFPLDQRITRKLYINQ
jgi:hypothetical protein